DHPVVSLFLLLVLLLSLFAKIIDFNGLYGADSYEYVRYSIALKDYLTHGIAPGKFMWPVIYPFAGALLSILLSPVQSLQLVSIVAFAAALIYIFKIINLIFPEAKTSNTIYTILFCLLSPYFLRLSFCVMSDMLAIAFCTASLYHTLKHRFSYEKKEFIYSVILAILAVLTHYSSFIILTIPLIVLTVDHYKKSTFTAFTISIALISVALIVIILVQPEIFLNAFYHPLLQKWSFTNFINSEFNFEDGLHTYEFPNIIFVLFPFVHPGFCFAGLLFLPMTIESFRKQRIMLLIALSLLIYLLFLAGTPNQNIRLLTMAFPLVIIIYFMTFHRLLISVFNSKGKKALLVGSIIVLQTTLFFFAFKGIRTMNKTERSLCEKLMRYNMAHYPIYTFGMDGAIRTYGIRNKTINLWSTKVTTLPQGAFILINERELNQQWQGKLPMLNWEYIRRNYQPYPTGIKEGNWMLYGIN
ncbi:MAG: hypothetical protein JNL63_09930, partial [Bacteroidia bacterium]|nr:hypothetical protein [Bacteroidia bacterium]